MVRSRWYFSLSINELSVAQMGPIAMFSWSGGLVFPIYPLLISFGSCVFFDNKKKSKLQIKQQQQKKTSNRNTYLNGRIKYNHSIIIHIQYRGCAF